LDYRGDGELHDLQVVGGITGCESSGLQQELINTDQAQNVTGWNIVNRINLTTHHENGTLDGLDEKIILLSWGVVWTLDTDLQTGLDSTSEDTTESVETTLIRGWHHLGDVQHERSLRITVSDTNAGLIIWRTLVKSLGTISLCGDWGWQVEDQHLQKSIGSWEESSHNDLEQLLALLLLVLWRKLNVELLKKDWNLLSLEVHDGGEDSENWIKNKLVEGTLERLSLVGWLGGPLLGVWVEVIVALKFIR
jgi:hypothetical protein